MNDLEFDGLNANNKAKASGKYAGNHSGLTAKENYGRGPTKAGQTGDQAGPSTAAGKSMGTRKWEPKCEQNYVGNYDKIQERQLFNKKGNLK